MLQCMDVITVAHKGHNANFFFSYTILLQIKNSCCKNQEVESQNECPLHKSKVKTVKCEF